MLTCALDVQSHHRPREGPFELNDVFAIINAVPAIGLLSYGFFNKGLFPGLCFGAVSPIFFFFVSISAPLEPTQLTIMPLVGGGHWHCYFWLSCRDDEGILVNCLEIFSCGCVGVDRVF